MNKTRHISATQVTNKDTGKRTYYHDGKRVSYETFAFAAIRADRISCLSSTEGRRVRRNHSLLTIEG